MPYKKQNRTGVLQNSTRIRGHDRPNQRLRRSKPGAREAAFMPLETHARDACAKVAEVRHY